MLISRSLIFSTWTYMRLQAFRNAPLTVPLRPYDIWGVEHPDPELYIGSGWTAFFCDPLNFNHCILCEWCRVYEYRSVRQVAMNTWHIVRFTRQGRRGRLQVDDQPIVIGASNGAFTQLTLSLDLFIGGHRNYDEVARLANVERGFQGCIQKVNGHTQFLAERYNCIAKSSLRLKMLSINIDWLQRWRSYKVPCDFPSLKNVCIEILPTVVSKEWLLTTAWHFIMKFHLFSTSF